MELLKEINGWMSVKFLLQRALSPRPRHHLGSFSSTVKATASNLGLIFNQFLTFHVYIKSMTFYCFLYLRNIAKLRTVVSKGKLEMLFYAFIAS